MINRHQPHVFLLPEDDANRQLANGFVLAPGVDTRRVQILPEAGGWKRVLECFRDEHVPIMTKLNGRHLVLLLDFDQSPDRLVTALTYIPPTLRNRVFILGVESEPERLRAQLGCGYERIGHALAKDCREGTTQQWEHPLLAHNIPELERLQRVVRPILFTSM